MLSAGQNTAMTADGDSAPAATSRNQLVVGLTEPEWRKLVEVRLLCPITVAVWKLMLCYLAPVSSLSSHRRLYSLPTHYRQWKRSLML